MCPLRRSSSGGLFTTPARGPPRRLSGWASGHVQAITRGHRGSCIGFPASWRPHARPRGAHMLNSESMATWIGRGLGHWRCPQLPPQPGASFMHSFVRIALAAFRPRAGSRRMPRARGPTHLGLLRCQETLFFLLCHAIRMCVPVPAKRSLLSAKHVDRAKIGLHSKKNSG